jgi:hypothetical protein
MTLTGEMYEEWRKRKPEFSLRDRTRFRLAPAVDAILIPPVSWGETT